MRRSFVVIASLAGLLVHAQERHDQEQRPPERPAEPPRPNRSQPSQFVPHAPGRNPRSPATQPHQTRSLAPRVMSHGQAEWRHWNHPTFPRPHYYWDWAAVRAVTCVAEDSYGDQYPVTQNIAAGFGLQDMTPIEDAALDRCFSESGQDPSCRLVSCTHT